MLLIQGLTNQPMEQNGGTEINPHIGGTVMYERGGPADHWGRTDCSMMGSGLSMCPKKLDLYSIPHTNYGPDRLTT
jgi:hypothetical protein